MTIKTRARATSPALTSIPLKESKILGESLGSHRISQHFEQKAEFLVWGVANPPFLKGGKGGDVTIFANQKSLKAYVVKISVCVSAHALQFL